MPALLIKNGRVIDPAARHDAVADVWIDGCVVKGVGPNLTATDAEVFDATGLIVAPGFIDMHVHLREPGFKFSYTIERGSRAEAAPGFKHAETIESGPRAAAAGRFTSIFPMPNPKPLNDNATVTSYMTEKARR